MSGFAEDYIPVNERIGAFYAKHPEGSLQSELVELTESRVVMRAYAYRTPDDARPGIGYSSLEIPGRTSFTKGSEVENCETSAWGRAIAALGFEVKRGIATAEEVRNKAEPAQHAPQRHVAAAPRRSSTAVPEPEWDGLPVSHPNGTGHGTGPMTTRELLNLAEAKGLDIKRVGDEARRMYGKWKLVELTDEQRQSVAEELSLIPVAT
jgi:hypothetical protein